MLASPDVRDAWGTELARRTHARGIRDKTILHRAQRRPGQAIRYGRTIWSAISRSAPGASSGDPARGRTASRSNIEHDRGPFNGLAEIAGTVVDPTGAAVRGASVNGARSSRGKTRTVTTNAAGQFSLAGLPAGEYEVQVSWPGSRSLPRSLLSAQRATRRRCRQLWLDWRERNRGDGQVSAEQQGQSWLARGVGGGMAAAPRDGGLAVAYGRRR